jgi:NarL family two-component system response regulator LiaR
MTFLIAEDNLRMRDSIKRFLTRSIPNHHIFLEAHDGGEAVKMYNQHAPDWVLMDIEMEPMDGLAALKSIRASSFTAKVIIVTSYDDAAYRKAAKEEGACGYVLKTHLDELGAILAPKEE